MIEENCVLFVDDEEAVLSSLKRQFRKADFKLCTAVGGKAALDLLKTQPVKIIITDERMPGMNGVELLQKIKKLYPDTIRIILSGYADSSSIIDEINKGEIYRFISKPWSKEKLLEVIEQAISHYKTVQQNKKQMELIIEENKQLHRDLDSRKNSLEITCEILDLLPTPVFVITHEDTVGCFNSEAGKIQDIPLKAGASLRSLFPESIVVKILQGFKLPGGQTSLNWETNGRTLAINIRAMRSFDFFKGLVFIIN